MASKRERFAPYWHRFAWDVRNLFNNDANPYVLQGEGDALPKRRTGFEDITHAFKNLFVEGWRILKS